MKRTGTCLLLLCAGAWALFGSVIARADSAPTHPRELHDLLGRAKAAGTREAHTGALAASLDQVFYDARYYDLDLRLDIGAAMVYGDVYMEAQSLKDGLTQFDVDLYFSMTVDSVLMLGNPVAFSHVGSELYVTPSVPLDSGDAFAVQIYYHGNPTSGGFGAFGFDAHGSPSVPMVWSLSEPYYARNWWPCKDTPSDKADSLDIRITCPDDLLATSNGVLASRVDHGDGTSTFHWRHRHPIPTYLVSIAVSNFQELSYSYTFNGGADSMPVKFWVYPERVADAQNSYPEILDMLAVFETYYGPYAFRDEKYAITHFVWGGGMEHQTNTSQSSSWYSWALNAHELSHQWFGDLITCQTWKDIWLNEGFASWSEALYREALYGAAAYRTYMQSMQYKGGGTIYVDDTTSVSRIFNGGLSYDKGAWAVHMLRGVLGDSTFFAALQEYRVRHGYGSATTEDFRAVCEDVSGLNLFEFFNDWIYGTYYPRYIYGYYVDSTDSGYLARVRINQYQGTPPTVFDMPVQLRFTAGALESWVTVQNDQRTQYFDVALPFDPDLLEFDPHGWILKDAFEGVGITSSSLRSGPRDEPYADTLQAERGTPPYNWELVEGHSAPPGLTLGQNGVLSGTPWISGDYQFDVQVRDQGAPPGQFERTISMTVGQPLRPPGDINADGQVTTVDILELVAFVFQGGPPPDPLAYGDVDLSCTVTSADIVFLVNYVFKSGPQPLDGCA